MLVARIRIWQMLVARLRSCIVVRLRRLDMLVAKIRAWQMLAGRLKATSQASSYTKET